MRKIITLHITFTIIIYTIIFSKIIFIITTLILIFIPIPSIINIRCKCIGV